MTKTASDLVAIAMTDEIKTQATAVRDAAKAMSGMSLDEQRKKFVDLSSAVIALADKAPPSSEVAKVLFVAHCPMANEGTGADWIQQTDAIANPFFASSMKECGSVIRRIESKQK